MIPTQNIRRFNAALFCALIMLCVPLTLSAHGTGASFERVVDGMLIDIGYSPEEITVATPVPFDFALVDAETDESVSYSDIWVRVYQDRNVFFASSIHKQRLGATTMLFQFPEPGTYTLSVRFQNDGIALAESSFEVPVVAGVGEEVPEWTVRDLTVLGGIVFAAITLSVLLAWVIILRRRA
jgi:hypothetical protein